MDTKYNVQVLPLNAIRENPVALRAVNKETEEYINLVDSIRSKGVMNAISVREKKEKNVSHFEIVDGLHRFSASIDAGRTDIPAQIVNYDDSGVLEAQLMANMHKIETRPVEYSKQILRILASNPTWTNSELATRLCKSPSWIGERLGLLKLDPKIQELVNSGKVNLSNAYPLAKLPSGDQIHFIDQAMTMSPAEFVPTINSRIKELRESARKGREAAPAAFTPVAHLRKLSEIKDASEKIDQLASMIKAQKISEPPAVAKLVLQWVLNMDPVSIEQQKSRDDARRKQADDEKKARQAERDAKKVADAAKVKVELEAAAAKAVKK